MGIRAILGASLIIGLFAILAANFGMLWLHGGNYLIYEHNRFILAVESFMTICIGIFGIERLMDALKTARQQKK